MQGKNREDREGSGPDMFDGLSSPGRWAWFSPWVIMGSMGILAGILLILAVTNVHREKEVMTRTLLSEARTLMSSLEASSRTGMRGMGWGRPHIQLLLEETARHADVEYVGLVDAAGKIVADSRAGQVGKWVDTELPPPGGTAHRFLEGDSGAFEVVREYRPWRHPHRHRRPRHKECPFPCFEPGGEMENLFILVGLNPAPFQGALRQDLHQTLLLFAILFLVGAAGFISLVWAQHYRTARRSLLDIRAFTSTVVHQMPVGLLAADARGRIQAVNQAAREILGPLDTDARIDDLPCFTPIARRIREEGTVLEEEVRHRVGESKTLPLLVNAAALRDGEGKAAGYILLFKDMSNIKHLEEQLRRSQRLAALGRLAAGVAHEIRNPLGSIKGFAAILAGRAPLDEQAQRISQVMQQEVERINRSITELLDFARPTALSLEASPCGEIVAHTLRLVEHDAAQRGVEARWEVIPEDLSVVLDPDRFAQILLNLYLNALQAMENGGRLSVRVQEEDGQVVWTVSDTGRGIGEQDLPHVFDPYFTTKPKGVGLGLAVAHKLTEAHGGDIRVFSTPGEGTRFEIRLPGDGKAPPSHRPPFPGRLSTGAGEGETRPGNRPYPETFRGEKTASP